MNRRSELIRLGHKTALEARRSLGLSNTEALCVYDIAERMGIEVRFVDIPSMEGAYLNQSAPVILVSSHRPAGRQAFTCAHEIAHHVFGHGSHLDELAQSDSPRRFQPEEFLADAFAAALLMPKGSVGRAFQIRGLDINTTSPADFYGIAWWLGVGYSTLVYHTASTLRLLAEARAETLLRHKPRDIGIGLLGRECQSSVVPVDQNWIDRPVDVFVGDVLVAPAGTRTEGMCVSGIDEDDKTIIQAHAPGIGRLSHDTHDWSAYVRVSRKGFCGRSSFRHLEDPDL